ncbi:MAG TPA: rubredoxin [Noviherbaspirillum sp.]|jgi:rubredoxin-NAD+ reductase
MMEATTTKTWVCIICGLVYDEAQGWPDEGIAPGTRWEDVRDDWCCPDCGVTKADFEMMQV